VAALLFLRLLIFASTLSPPNIYQPPDLQARGTPQVMKIWGRAPHNAFTDLIRFQER
jgi:hypothetical protein